MGERKGVNKYYPPDWTPKMGNLNKYHGTHALRERARKIHEGIIIVRFEIPYNIWCGGCGIHIGMGVRYNAQKRKVGNYYTTPIYKFRMKCHLCDQYFEIQTDPQNCDYVILSGARRKEERWDPAVTENVQTTDRDVKEKLVQDAMFKLEHEIIDKQKAIKVAPTLNRLEEIRDTWKDDYAVNQVLREKFRSEKKDINLEKVKAEELRAKGSLPSNLEILPEAKEDVKLARRIKYGADNVRPDIARRQLRMEIKQGSIFGSAKDSKVALANKLSNISYQKTRKVASKTTLDSKDVSTLVRRNPKSDSDKLRENKSSSGDDPGFKSNEESFVTVSEHVNDIEIKGIDSPPDDLETFSEHGIKTDKSIHTLKNKGKTPENDTLRHGPVQSESKSVLTLLSAYCDSDSSDDMAPS